MWYTVQDPLFIEQEGKTYAYVCLCFTEQSKVKCVYVSEEGDIEDLMYVNSIYTT